MADVLRAEGVRLGLTAADKWDAVRQSGALLAELGAVEPGYPEAMLERERSVSTFIGEGVAIPHGTDASRVLVRATTLGFLQFPGGVDWDGDDVRICVAIAAQGDEHVGVLSGLAQILMEADQAERLRTATRVEDVLALLSSIGEGSHACAWHGSTHRVTCGWRRWTGPGRVRTRCSSGCATARPAALTSRSSTTATSTSTRRG